MSIAALSCIPPLLAQCSSWNLHLDKFSFQRNGPAEAKADALRNVMRSYERAKGLLEKAVKSRQAWLDSMASQHGIRLRKIRLYNISPLILHLGRASVLENVGLFCERSTGLPVIPGTAVKGVLSTWACWESNQLDDGSFPEPGQWTVERTASVARIFGIDTDSSLDCAGDISFLGAWPASVPKLSLDIVNPHRDSMGRDLQRLTPSVFLSLDRGTAWDFVFIARAGAEDADAILATTEQWLKDCLSQVGIGAKTAAGYGRFASQLAQASRPGSKQLSPEDIKAHDEAIATLQADYPNGAVFKNRVLEKLSNPAQLSQLQKEIALLMKPENASWLEKLKECLKGPDAKKLRKTLKEKEWFPQEWIPS